jgi:ABC transporter, permease protein
MVSKARKVKQCWQDKVFYTICYTLTVLLTLVVLYPIIYIVSASFSSGSAITSGKVFLYPVDISLLGYKAVLKYKNVWIGYRNTLFYTCVGTLINVCLTLLCAYPLARKNLRGRGFFTMIFTFTMIFSGGMIPNYILMKKLGLINTVWSMLLPGAMSVYNMIVARTFIQNNIPDELIEAARIDGCSDVRMFFKIVLPLSKAIIAVLALWYAVGHWNSYFHAFLYLSDKRLYPLQIFLKDILVQSEFNADLLDPDIASQMANLKTVLKYSMIVVSTVPLFCFYPFVQKYFVKGVMIGSVKG